ncbi:MAG: septum formation protein Maf [Alphaproteobacteria bacterium]|nr:septum formation protein Maf [Alphaproteobacteria bacterium]
MTPVILASSSAIRARLLREAGLTFGVRPAHVDEEELKESLLVEGATPEDVAVALAEVKAVRVSGAAGDALVIGADQVLVLDGVLVDKCQDLTEARDLLARLRGRRHSLVSACAIARSGAVIWRTREAAQMHMRAFSDAFLDDYIKQEGRLLLSCVGCYQLERRGAQLFDRIDGDTFTVLGLPLLPLLDALREHKAMPS